MSYTPTGRTDGNAAPSQQNGKGPIDTKQSPEVSKIVKKGRLLIRVGRHIGIQTLNFLTPETFLLLYPRQIGTVFPRTGKIQMAKDIFSSICENCL